MPLTYWIYTGFDIFFYCTIGFIFIGFFSTCMTDEKEVSKPCRKWHRRIRRLTIEAVILMLVVTGVITIVDNLLSRKYLGAMFCLVLGAFLFTVGRRFYKEIIVDSK